MKTKLEWVRQLRRCNSQDTLNKVYERVMKRLDQSEKEIFLMAFDHRIAEITMNRLYDKIPVSVWKYVK